MLPSFLRVCALATSVAIVGCNNTQTFTCSSDDDCVDESIVGQCEPNSFCSFPDPACESERRYGDLAPTTQSQQCVPPGGGSATTTVTGQTSTDATLDTQESNGGEEGSGGDGSTAGSDGGDAAPAPAWARSFGAPTDPGAMEPDADFLSDLTLDADGNVYTVGPYRGMINFDDIEGSSAGASDAWVISLTPGGDLRWATPYGTAGHDSNAGVTLDANGDVVVVGALSGDPGFGEGSWRDGALQAYIARFDSGTGTPQAAVALPSEIGSSRFLDVATGANGSIYAVGGFYDTIALDVPRTSLGQEDIVVTRFDGQLNPTASWTAGGTSVDLGRSIAVAVNGNVAIGCFYVASAEAPTDDIEVRTFDANLNEGWHRREPAVSVGGSKVHRVAFTGNDVIAAGFMASAITLGQPQAHAGGHDAFVARLGTSGETLWAHAWGGVDNDSLSGVVVDDAGDIIVVGQVTNVPEILGVPVNPLGGGDMAVVKLSANGDIVWAETYGGDLDDGLAAVAVDGQGRVFTGGRFRGDLTIGGIVLTAAETSDAAVMRLDH